jgi:hypothetical protein
MAASSDDPNRMTRILTTLAIVSLVLMQAALILGVFVGDLYRDPSADTLQMATIHRLTGIAAALGVVFVESVVATYFIGTSRWCKEVSETYRLDAGRVQKSNRLKRRAIAVAVVGMLTVVGIIALGGAADPATGRPHTQFWTIYHMSAAMIGFAIIAWTYFVAWQYVWQQNAIIQEIVAEVGKIRREKGLEPLTAAAK